jgi:small-conductance mechanosensitive channel
VIIAVSGYVNSPQSMGGAPSDLPLTVLVRLRESGIALSSPQSTVLVTESGEKLQPGK